jgi:hypothetical protein
MPNEPAIRNYDRMSLLADTVAKVESRGQRELLRAMFDVGSFPPNTPPPIE